jgi:hypothetical protein
MGYKILGFVVWNGAKWYIRRNVHVGTGQKIALLTVSAALVGGAVVAGRQLASHDDS